MNKQYNLEIIAGPCSITEDNVSEIINEIASIKTHEGVPGIYGTRVVGLKSRTSLALDGAGMGLDYPVIKRALRLPATERDLLELPTVSIMEEIVQTTGLMVATEIMLPHIQLPFYQNSSILNGNLMVWNPSVNQLGWSVLETSAFVNRNNWKMGIKHGKFLGKEHSDIADNPDYIGETTLEKTWKGLATSYSQISQANPILIHRGVDVPREGLHRSLPVHNVAKRVKLAVQGSKMYFDPSHSFGPDLRDKIVDETIKAMKLKLNDGFLYDGILIEAGTSPSDTEQHITISELQYLVNELSKFRHLRSPKIIESNIIKNELLQI